MLLRYFKKLPILASLVALSPGAAFAQATEAATPNKGDTAWMLMSTVLVFFMILPGIGLFYGGMVRAKNMLSVLTQIMVVACVVCLLWIVYGYSLAFTAGGDFKEFIGDFSKLFLIGVSPASTTADGGLPEYVFICFQMTFAMLTPTLIVGSFAERMRFPAVLLFSILWFTFVYIPIAHMVWGGGLLAEWGALDFAGGTVVHINAGIAGLVGCLLVGKRIGFGKELIAPHSLTMTMIGGAMLWFGWFGFNAGSALKADGGAGLAMINTFVATAAAGLAWLLAEWILKGHPSMLGLVSGAIAGLVAVTPAAGFAGPMGSIVLGLLAGVVCFVFCSTIKNAFGYDDTLDVFGIHGVGGIIGAIATGIVVAPALGGTGLATGEYVMATQVWIQTKAVLVSLLWTGIGSLILFKLVGIFTPLRASSEEEREGLDLAEHGERAYNY
ncbi:ammonium transporter [Microvirga sp. W0021]|uniref:Ammonium transporter n=1 Tax=Hohaiivirga grylli TaxID=3133970 RepID=A0ABV0BF19_9HYPH